MGSTDFTNKDLGRKGEAVAASFLERHGCRIVARNYRCRAGEIDIIAEETGPTVRFVDAAHATTIPYSGVGMSTRNRLTPQFMGFL